MSGLRYQGDLNQTLKTEEISKNFWTKMKQIRDANLLIIDDGKQNEPNLSIHLFNDLYNKSSIILSPKKAPKDWGAFLVDRANTTAV